MKNYWAQTPHNVALIILQNFSKTRILQQLLITKHFCHSGMWPFCLKFAKYCVAHQAFGRMCSVVVLAFTLKLPIQTWLSVVPIRSVFWRTTKFQQNKYIPGCSHENKNYAKKHGLSCLQLNVPFRLTNS